MKNQKIICCLFFMGLVHLFGYVELQSKPRDINVPHCWQGVSLEEVFPPIIAGSWDSLKSKLKRQQRIDRGLLVNPLFTRQKRQLESLKSKE